MQTTPARSLSERVVAAVRADILAGRFISGQRLRPTELAAVHGVSLNVVREALNRLAGEGLVLASAQLGFSVLTLSDEDLRDLTETRELVETAAIRRSIERGDVRWESRLAAAHHMLAHTDDGLPDRPGEFSVDWSLAHNDFHAATMAACGSQRLLALSATLANDATIYRHQSRLYERGERDVAEEHRSIYQATLDRDADLATRLHVEHIRRTAAIVSSAFGAGTGAIDAFATDARSTPA